MARKQTSKRRKNTIFYLLLQMSIAALLLIYGMEGIAKFGTSQSAFYSAFSRVWSNAAGGEIFVILVYLLCGASLAVSYFLPAKDMYKDRIMKGVLIAWGVLTVLLHVLLPNFHSRFFDWLLWGRQVTVHIIVFLSLFILRKVRL